MSNEPDEDLIEATIRRVAASKAARRPDPIEDEIAAPGTPAPELHLVGAAHDDAPDLPPTQRAAPDESLIEATLRRIEAQQAARAAAVADDVPASEQGLDVAAYTAPAAAPAIRQEREMERQPSPELHLVRADADVQGEPSSDFAALRRDLDEALRQLSELRERVDALSAPVREPRLPVPTPAPARAAEPAHGAPGDDDWSDEPVITRIDTGLPPRPPIMRDPIPTTTAAMPEPSGAASSLPPHENEAKRGFDLLPRSYRITVEDKRRGVDLVPLHRALLGMDGVRDMSLLSYSNGTAIVALEATTEILPDALAASVAHAMAREVKVEVHNEQTMVLKLAED